jgi:hypothetical protein
MAHGDEETANSLMATDSGDSRPCKGAGSKSVSPLLCDILVSYLDRTWCTGRSETS